MCDLEAVWVCMLLLSALLLFPSGDGRVYVFVCFSQSCCQFHKPLLWVCQTVAYSHGEKQNEATATNTASLADSPRVVDKTDAQSEIRPYFTCVTNSHTIEIITDQYCFLVLTINTWSGITINIARQNTKYTII